MGLVIKKMQFLGQYLAQGNSVSRDSTSGLHNEALTRRKML